jgi:hypothetical protein
MKACCFLVMLCLAGGGVEEGGPLRLVQVILVPVPAQQTDHLRPESTIHGRTLEGACVSRKMYN